MTTYARLVEIAADLRRRAGQVEPSFSTMQIIETCFPNTLVTGRALPSHLDETVTRGAGGHVIVYRRGLSTPEQRQAIAHALGHIIFDGAATVCGVERDSAREERCDRFADELLVPLDELAHYVTCGPSTDRDRHEVYLDMVDLIASHFGVMADVIHRRIAELPHRSL